MLDRFNGEPANTFARYNAATQQGLRDEDATVYANDTSLNNPAMVNTTQTDSPYTTLNKDTRNYVDFTTNDERKAIGDYLLRQDQAAGIGLSETIKKLEIMSGMAAPDLTEDYYSNVAEATAALYPEKFQFEGQLASGRYNVIDPDTGKAVTYKDKETYDNLQAYVPPDEPQPTDPTDLEQNTMVDPDPVDEDTTDYTPYQYVKDGETYQVSDEEIKEITLYKQLGYNNEEINNFLNQRFSFRTPTVVEEVDQNLYEDDTEAVVQPEAVTQPVVQGTNAVYKPIPQTDSSTYTPTPYDPSAPTYTTPAQVTTTPTQFNPQYVAGPVQQTYNFTYYNYASRSNSNSYV